MLAHLSSFISARVVPVLPRQIPYRSLGSIRCMPRVLFAYNIQGSNFFSNIIIVLNQKRMTSGINEVASGRVFLYRREIVLFPPASILVRPILREQNIWERGNQWRIYIWQGSKVLHSVWLCFIASQYC